MDEPIKELLIKYRKKLNEGDYSLVDGSAELEEIIHDLGILQLLSYENN